VPVRFLFGGGEARFFVLALGFGFAFLEGFACRAVLFAFFSFLLRLGCFLPFLARLVRFLRFPVFPRALLEDASSRRLFFVLSAASHEKGCRRREGDEQPRGT
jgi:hypothetical protein